MSAKSLLGKLSSLKGARGQGPQLDRAQIISLLLAFGIVAVSIVSSTLVLMSRADALAELSDREDQLARLQAAHAQRAKSGKGAAQERDAPESAFLSAATAALAGAQLQTYLTEKAAQQNANISSSGLQATARDDAEAVRLQASFDMKLTALQKLLYDLETGTPYIFIDALAVQPQGDAPHANDEPLLHVTMTLRALWRKSST